METKKTLFGIMAAATMLTSCLNDEGTYRAGFGIESPTSNISYYYANNVSDSLIFYGYGNWDIIDMNGYDNSWITVPTRQGKGSVLYSQLVNFEQNTTGSGRTAAIQIRDTNHPGEAHVSLAFIQYATRGDGSLGSAADVKSITGSDGSNITLEYDVLHRPTSVKIQKSEQTLNNLQISYGKKMMAVKDVKKGLTYSVDCENDYQPQMLISGGDTVGYFSRYYSSMVVAPANYIFNFNFEHRGVLNSSCVTYRFTYGKYSLNPDSLHNCDSLFYYDNQKLMRKLALSYGEQDNRYQSVDANQLLLGVEACDPYLLASLFRYARNTSIIAEAKNDDEQIQVSATLNADKSIHQLMVKRDDETITYTFNY
jgi:hypothetical protein